MLSRIVSFFQNPKVRRILSGIGAKVMLITTILAGLPYEKTTPGSPGAMILAMVPENHKPAFLSACGLLALILGIWNACEQGNNKPNTP